MNQQDDIEVLVVTRHFARRWGGGEHSLAAVLDEFQTVQPGWTWTLSDGDFDPPNRLRPLPLVQLILRRNHLRHVAANFRGRLAFLQSLVGPTLLNALPREVATVFFMRDTRYWDAWPNHETGPRRAAKALYRLAMAPLVAAFRRETRRALERADLIVANSAFMAERILAFCGREALIVYPRTPVATAPLPAGSVVGMVGDGVDKGGRILCALAESFPDVSFRLHGHHPVPGAFPSNILAAGRESDPARLYQGLQLMLVPSQVAEAYGRVVVEALGHGVPVLASRVGGLPETVPNLAWTVANHDNADAWRVAFADAWSAAPSRRDEAYAFAAARRLVVDAQHRELVQRVLALVGETASSITLG
ncbi:hypothetical protein CCP3SC1_720005 [Gammaproteobacteria bacterium]